MLSACALVEEFANRNRWFSSAYTVAKAISIDLLWNKKSPSGPRLASNTVHAYPIAAK